MNSLNKSKYIKLGSVIFLIIGLLLISESNSHARFMKKIVVEPLLNPKDWQKSFMPGTAFTLMLENSLAKSGQFQIIRSPKDSAKKILSSIFKTKDIVEGENQEVIREENQGPNDKEIQENKKGARIEGDNFSEQTSSLKVPSSQYQVRGQILIFDPDTNPIKGSQTRNQVLRYKEKAKVKVVVELINLRTERSLAKKSFTFISNDGRTAFNSDLTTLDYETLEFKSSSIGKAFWKLNNSVEAFIVRILNDVPLEGDLISVDYENKSAIINLGEANGIKVQDVFTVFSMEANFTDPLNQTDLGDKYTRKGVIKIIEVQGRFSRAQITVGLDLASGDLVVPKYKNSIRHKSDDQLSENNVIWGDYKGLPSLTY